MNGADPRELIRGSGGTIEPWDPRVHVRAISPLEAQMSCGFLRCHPEKWLPGFSTRWTPVMSALGCDLRVGEIKPSLALPDSNSVCCRGTIDGESVVVAFDPSTVNAISNEVASAGERSKGSMFLLEYLAQRFLACIGQSHAGVDRTSIQFSGRCALDDFEVVASVRLSFALNSNPASVVIGLGRGVVERMDGMWRRQLHSSIRPAVGAGMLRIEVAQLGVPPSLLSEYLTSGTVIDLEVPISDCVTLRVGHKPFMPARLVSVEGRLGCQVIQGVLSNLSVPDGTSRLSIECGAIPVDEARITELGQVGAVLTLEQAISSAVSLVINQERVGESRLGVHQGRFAVEVL